MLQYFDGMYMTDDNNLILQHFSDVERLLKQTYWAQNRNKELIRKSIDNSICYAVVDDGRDRLIAFARAITDYATLYCLEDVIVDESYRGRGIGKMMVQYITEHETKLEGQFGVVLTKDAQGLYSKYGFKEYYDTCMYKV